MSKIFAVAVSDNAIDTMRLGSMPLMMNIKFRYPTLADAMARGRAQSRFGRE